MKSGRKPKPRKFTWRALLDTAQWGCGFILLSGGGFALVDEDVMEELDGIDWYATRRRYIRRTVRGASGRTSEYLHRRIMGAEPQDEVDHKNRIPSDNRRENLRLCAHRDNCANTTHRKSASGYKGVHQLSDGRYRAGGGRESRFTYLGVYKTAQQAAVAYNQWATATFGEFACLNQL